MTDIPTKKALKEAFANKPTLVTLYETSMGNEHKVHFWNSLEIGVKYSVVGPNPYNSRKWYATVEKKQDGTIKVS